MSARWDPRQLLTDHCSASVVFGLCLLAYLLFVVHNINKPFTTDEVYYAGWADGLSKGDGFFYYAGEITTLRGINLHETLSHPPLHFLVLAVPAWAFGLKYWSLRLVGVLALVATVAFVALIRRRLELGTKELALLAVFVVFNPLFLQQSLVLAIESQAMWFPVLVFLFVLFRESKAPTGLYPFALTTLALVVLFWLKVTNVPTYVGAAVAYLLLQKRFKLVAWFLVAFASAVVFFAFSWWLYCNVTQTEIDVWWRFTVERKILNQIVDPERSKFLLRYLSSGDLEGAVAAVKKSVCTSIAWISTPLAALFVLSLVVRVRALLTECQLRAHERSSQPVSPAPSPLHPERTGHADPEPNRLDRSQTLGFFDLCALYSLFTLAAANIARPSGAMLKYEVPAYLFAALFAAKVLAAKCGSAWRYLGAVALVAAFVCLALHPLVPDRILDLPSAVIADLRLSGVVTIGCVGVLLAMKQPIKESVVVALIVALLVSNGILHIKQSASYTTGVSWAGVYGTDFAAVTSWLNENLEDGDGFAAFKDLQFNMRFVEGKKHSKTYEVRIFTHDRSRREYKQSLLRSGDIKYVALRGRARHREHRRFFSDFEVAWEDAHHLLLRHRSIADAAP